MLNRNLVELLEFAAAIAWVIFGIYVTSTFVRTYRRFGLVISLVRLLSFRVTLPLLLTMAITLLNLAIVFIQPQQVGVVVSIISPGGVRPQPFRGGLHWIVPLLEQVEIYPIHWQTYSMTNKPSDGQTLGSDSIRARTKDGQEVRLDTSVIFRINPARAVQVHVDWQDRYMSDLVRPLVRGIVRRQVSQFEVAEVNSSDRANLEASLDRLFQEEFEDKGFIMDQFLLRDITFTPEYAGAVENKQVALEGQVMKEYEAEQIRRLARGEADAIEIKAEAQANALRLIGETLAENRDLVTYHYVDKLSPNIRAMLVPNSSPLILPLPDLLSSESVTSTVPISPTLEFNAVPETVRTGG